MGACSSNIAKAPGKAAPPAANLKNLAERDGLLDLTNRGIDTDAFGKICHNVQMCKKVKSLVLSKNPMTALLMKVPTREEIAWPSIELLDLSSNPTLYDYSELDVVAPTLNTLKCSGNDIFKIPMPVFSLSNLSYLDLSNNRIASIPPNIALLTNLSGLNLSHNSLSFLPDELQMCSRLQVLDLSHNKFAYFPFSKRKAADLRSPRGGPRSPARSPMRSPVRSPMKSPMKSPMNGGEGVFTWDVKGDDDKRQRNPLPHLSYLNMSHNYLEELPLEIGRFRCLGSLNVSHNKLKSLPCEIALLAELKILDLRFNQLQSLIPELCTLTRLAKLSIQNNKISSLPTQIKSLKRLTHLLACSNQLVDLPESLRHLKSLRTLRLCNNKILTLSDSLFSLPRLRVLDISFNRLNYLSTAVCHMKMLCTLRAMGNQIKDIPKSLLMGPWEQLQDYLAATEAGRMQMNTQMRSMGPSRRTHFSTRDQSLSKSLGLPRSQTEHSTTGPQYPSAPTLNDEARKLNSTATLEPNSRGTGQGAAIPGEFAPIGYLGKDDDDLDDDGGPEEASFEEEDSDYDLMDGKPKKGKANLYITTALDPEKEALDHRQRVEMKMRELTINMKRLQKIKG